MWLFQLWNFAFGSETVTLLHLPSKISLQVLFSSFFCFVVHLFPFYVSVLMTYNLRHHTESTSLVFPPIGLSSSGNPVFIWHNGCIRYFLAGQYVYRNKKGLAEQIGDPPGGYPVLGFPKKKKIKKSLWSPVFSPNHFFFFFFFSYLNWSCYLSQTEGTDWTNSILLNFNPNK